MINIADYNELQILTMKIDGCYLDGGSETIFLPASEVPDGAEQGEYVDVFLFRGRDGLIHATTKVAPAVMDGYGAFTVRKVQEYGAFLDWGLGRDLFIPKRYYRTEFKEGDTIVVHLIPDIEEDSVIASELFNQSLEKADGSLLSEGEEVDIIVYELIERGARCIVNDNFPGLVYANETFEPLKIGDKKTGYVKKIREDGKLDIALQKQGFRQAVTDTRDVILNALNDAGGTLHLGDKSDPDDIKKIVHMSKKMFKKTIGGLYKEGKITISERQISLKK